MTQVPPLPVPRRNTPGLAAGLLPLLLACSGQLGDGHEVPRGDETTGGAGARGPAPGGRGGNAGSGGQPGPQAGGQPGTSTNAPSAISPVGLRRLNRTEYCNTLADVLLLRQISCQLVPADDVEGGFDTVAAALTISQLHVEAYEATVDEAVRVALADPMSRGQLRACRSPADADGCAAEVLTRFARRAWRRPTQPAELAPFLATVARARTMNSGDEALGQGLRAVLLSPKFLFRLELDPPSARGSRPLDDHELATRLSYALWRTMPDAELFAAADQGRVARPDDLRQQIRRMLAHEKAQAFVADFAGQWLELRALARHEVSTSVFKTFSEPVRAAMRQETERFVAHYLAKKLPMDTLLTADLTFLDATLARFYGLAAPAGDGFAQVPLTGTNRRGLLTHGSLLTLTSNPDETSAVKRGVWVLERLLCSEPPAVPEVPETMKDMTNPPTQREFLALHRSVPSCAACHKFIDPIGLGLENFDGVGLHRTTDKGKPIDASGELPDGQRFNGPIELAAMVAKDQRFTACIAEQLLTFAVGRVFHDDPGKALATELAKAARAQDGSLDALVTLAFTHPVFTTRAIPAQ